MRTSAPIEERPGGIHFRNVTLTYNTSAGPRLALGPMTLDVEKGEFVAVLGPSGCGKSTLLKVVSGLLPASTGEVSVGDKTVIGPRGDVGIVFQQPTLLPWSTIRENILMPVKVLGTYTGASEARVDSLLSMVGLQESKNLYPHELSGGMQQRVGIARGLMPEPKVLLMDEPFAALDAMTREQMTLDLQAMWTNFRQSVIFITHSIPEAVLLADRVVVLSKGPGQIIHVENVTIERPRTIASMTDPDFVSTCHRLRRLFTH